MSADQFASPTSFLPLGLQYLVSARFLALQLQVSVAGNLFHHAIEMFLKASLAHRVPVKRLASRALGHNLEALWTEFKLAQPKANEWFLPIIAALNRFEDIRYPVAGEIQGPQLHLAHFRQPDGRSMGAPGAYALALEDIDALIQHVIFLSGFVDSLKLDVGHLPTGSKQALFENNRHSFLAVDTQQMHAGDAYKATRA